VGQSGGLDPARSFFSALLTDVEAGRFDMGPAPPALAFAAAGFAAAFGMGPAPPALAFAAAGFAAAAAAALSSLDFDRALASTAAAAAAAVAAAAFAASAFASLDLDRALASAAVAAASRLDTAGEAALGGASFSAAGDGSNFGAMSSSFFAFKVFIFCIVRSVCALAFAWASFKMLTLVFLDLPFPGAGGGPPCGGGAIPAGSSPGPGTMCITRSLGVIFPDIRNPFVVFWNFFNFPAFPPVDFTPPALSIIGVPPAPGSGGGCPLFCSTSMGLGVCPLASCPTRVWLCPMFFATSCAVDCFLRILVLWRVSTSAAASSPAFLTRSFIVKSNISGVLGCAESTIALGPPPSGLGGAPPVYGWTGACGGCP
jgi:hypothetical protein